MFESIISGNLRFENVNVAIDAEYPEVVHSESVTGPSSSASGYKYSMTASAPDSIGIGARSIRNPPIDIDKLTFSAYTPEV